MNTAVMLQSTSGISAGVAAALWLWSARVTFPEGYTVHVVESDEKPLGGDPLGGRYVGQAHSQDFKSLANALKTQSRRSAWAAMAASISAAAQVIALFA